MVGNTPNKLRRLLPDLEEDFSPVRYRVSRTYVADASLLRFDWVQPGEGAVRASFSAFVWLNSGQGSAGAYQRERCSPEKVMSYGSID